jgi:hypothetical protein
MWGEIAAVLEIVIGIQREWYSKLLFKTNYTGPRLNGNKTRSRPFIR